MKNRPHSLKQGVHPMTDLLGKTVEETGDNEMENVQ